MKVSVILNSSSVYFAANQIAKASLHNGSSECTKTSEQGWQRFEIRSDSTSFLLHWWCFSNLNERNFMMNFLVPGPHKDSNK